MRKIGIDFDGTIVRHRTVPTRVMWWQDKPYKFALEAINKLKENNEVYILTARSKKDWPLIEQWLYLNGFPSLRITNTKEDKTDVFIDDRAIRFEGNWLSLIKILG